MDALLVQVPDSVWRRHAICRVLHPYSARASGAWQGSKVVLSPASKWKGRGGPDPPRRISWSGWRDWVGKVDAGGNPPRGGRVEAGVDEGPVAVNGAGEEVAESRGEGGSWIGEMADLFNLEKQFAFYGAYHTNKINVMIHLTCVWPIFFTGELFFAYSPAIVPFPLHPGTLPLQQYMILNVGFLIAATYALYYVALDKKAGTLGAAICLGCWIGAQAIAEHVPWSTAWKIVLISQVACWTFQFIGHGVFEKRAPALLSNFHQAFLMAPFFVLLEFLQSFFDYEPYSGFCKAVQKRVEENIAVWKSSRGKKIA